MRQQRRAPGAPSVQAPDDRDVPASAGAWPLRLLAPLTLLLVIAVVHAASHMDIGVDTWVSLAGGRQVIAHGVTLTDPFSFNSRVPEPPGDGGARLLAWLHPTGWINQNWLTHVFLARLVGSFGFDALAVWKLVNYLLVAALLLVNAQRRRANPVLATLLVAGALLASRQFFEVRAQDVTNLLAAALMLLLTVAALDARRAAWLVLPLFAVWGNVHGGFVWGLIALALFVAASFAASRLGGRLLIVPPATVRTVAIAAGGALAVVVALSPYRLANLTHALVISASADATVWRNVFEWLPLARGTAGERATFVLCAALAVVAVALTARRSPSVRASRSGVRAEEVADPTRALDLGSAAILVLTGVMAVKSRRFLPMAYLVGAPLLAQWLTCAGERLLRGRPGAAAVQPAMAAARAARRLAVPALWLLGVAVTSGYAAPFARSYLDPWPFDERHDSLADRTLLTAGEPWGACQFVTLNRLQGRMWNFWEAGGFWAWCQPADPATGRVAAQIAIDGRAQAAYDVAVYRWHDLLETGGPVGMRAESTGRQPGEEELAAIRSWVARRLGDDGIWLAHIAQRNADSQLARALLAVPSWQVVYADANHLLLVDIATPQGRDLAAAVDRGTAAFPDEVSGLLTRAYRALYPGAPDGAPRALALARQAWALQPTTRAVGLAARAGLDPACADGVRAFFDELINDQLARGTQYAQRPGYYERLVGAATAARFLEQTAATRRDVEARKRAAGQRAWLVQEANRVSLISEW